MIKISLRCHKFGNTFTLNLRFPGQYYDKETNTHYNINRDYNPLTGRYVQSDPIGLEGGVNTYLYANANPLGYVDEEGLDFWDGIANKVAFGDPRQKAYDAIVAIGYFLGLDSEFEKRMLRRWLFAEGDYRLSYAEYIEIVNGSEKYWTKLYGNNLPISTYKMPKYNFAIGSATLKIDGMRNIVGFYDVYDFNKGNRDFKAELATRVGAIIEEQTGAKPFKITY